MKRMAFVLVPAVVAPLVLSSPAVAVPPLIVSGTGLVSPGLMALADFQSFTFTGTGSDPVAGTSYSCSFYGGGPAGNFQMQGTMQGSCGPFAYPTCVFHLSLTTFSIGCLNTAGTMRVSFTNLNPATDFTATGVIV